MRGNWDAQDVPDSIRRSAGFPVPIAMVPVDRRAPADCEETLLSNPEKRRDSARAAVSESGF